MTPAALRRSFRRARTAAVGTGAAAAPGWRRLLLVAPLGLGYRITARGVLRVLVPGPDAACDRLGSGYSSSRLSAPDAPRRPTAQRSAKKDYGTHRNPEGSRA